MEEHWRLFFILIVAIGSVWVSISTLLLCRSSGGKRQQMRAYFCAEGFLLGLTGAMHSLIIVGILLVEFCFHHPVGQDVLKNCVALTAAWEGANFVAALLFLWRYVGRGTWIFECCHHISAASIAFAMMAVDMPLEIHLMIHWAAVQHTFVGTYRFLTWLWELDAGARQRWRDRVTVGALAHDISKLVTGLPAVAAWVEYHDLRLVDCVFITFTCLLGNVVLVNHGRKAISFRGKRRLSFVQDPPVEPVCKGAEQKVKIDTRALDGLRGFCAIYIACGHFLYYTHWAGEMDPSSVADWHWEEKRWDLHGGWFLSLFYMISGFQMTIGYAQKRWMLPGSEVDGRKYRCHRLLGRFIVGALGGSARDVLKEAEPAEVNEVPGDGAALKCFDARGFWRKRLLRLAPLYLLTNVAAMVGMCTLGVVGAVIRQQGCVAFAFWMGLWICGLTSWVPSEGTLPPNPVTWTISTMMSFYLAFPLVMPYLQRLPASCMKVCAWRMYVFRMPSVLLMVLAYIWLDSTAVDAYWLMRAFPLASLPIFVMGCCCGFATLGDYGQAQEQARQSKQDGAQDAQEDSQPSARCLVHGVDLLGRRLMILYLVCILFRRFGGTPYITHLLRPVGELLNPLLYYELVRGLTAADQDRALLARALRSRVFQFLGDISMGLYMVHWPVMTAISNLSFSYDPIDQHRSPILPAWGGAVALPCSVLLGWIHVKLVESTMSWLQRKPDGTTKAATCVGIEHGQQSSACEAKPKCCDESPDPSKDSEGVPVSQEPPNVEVVRV